MKEIQVDRQLPDLTIKLKELMQAVGINSFKQLCRSSGISDRTIQKLRSGRIETLSWGTIEKISRVLQIETSEFLQIFANKPIANLQEKLVAIESEYRHLQQQYQQQRGTLQAEFQYQSLQTLESLLTYLPAAKYAAQARPDFPASKIIPLLQPLDRLLQQWHVIAIGEVGSQIAYDPQWHQSIDGTIVVGEIVTVRFCGYRQGEKLIFRAKVARSS